MRGPLACAALAATLVTLRPAAARGDAFDLRDLDKQAHVAVSYGLTLTGAVIGRRYRLPRWQAVAIAAAATLAIGTAKELVADEVYSWGDQLGNALGAGAAAIVVFSFRL